MTRRCSLLVLAAAAALAAATAAAPALRADWLVTRQGERFETKGPWQLKGKLVVFNLPDGTLSSIRADRVDFDASKRAAEDAAKKAAEASTPPPPAEHRKAVIVLTDKDFHSSLPAAPGGADAAAPGAAAGAATAGKTGKDAPHDGPAAVEIVSWDRLAEADSKVNGIEIVGTLRNGSQVPLTEVTLTATLFDDSGNILARAPARVETAALAPSETSQFHVAVEGVFTFATVRWDTQWKSFKAPHEGKPAPAPTAAPPAGSPPAAQGAPPP